MPIEISTEIRACGQEEFHALDRRIMGVVFAVHNEFGRLLDEEIYKCEIAARCVEMGIKPVEREVAVRVSHDGFIKDYYLDLLFCSGAMLEVKVAETLVAAHRSQSLNYLFLAGLKHGTLVNFRTERVQHEFVSTTLTPAERRRFQVLDQGWTALTPASDELKSRTIELLQDWGAFLDVNLYREALVHFFGGPASVCKAVGIYSGKRCIGEQILNMLDADTAFAFTTKQGRVNYMKDHLERLLRHTSLQSIQWINMNRHLVEFTTIRK